ncbi:single-stranded DNA-binding protein [Alteromonas sp. K632G]|jgi:single-strand DNA-binding protein|uniref:single-stranded DNA-binding protein n=1 Tax=Alteromonas sp. K632G TaxID=2820757 RepID=UPI001AD7851C|nr:single-stranded DNA-binding protein [Alteromonas sp. K632G]MBO7920960.1 single-stranded DNA-binding protein [Alteromonas sp. K632G]
MATKGLNNVQIIGNLGNEPELAYTPNNVAKCVVNLATSEIYKDRNGNPVEDTEWHRVIIWGKRAELVHQFRAKGDQLYVKGKKKTRTYQDSNGNDKSICEIIVDQSGDVQLLGRKEAQSV